MHPAELYTIGHSTRTLEEFLALLHAYQITHLVDVRTIPKSRHVPWFNRESFSQSLAKEKIGYSHMSNLGGLRHSNKDSINQGWRNASFRGFADYMQTSEFDAALEALNKIMEKEAKLVIMCAEAVPWRCHRSLIADAEVARGLHVFHIMNLKTANPHELTAFAKIVKTGNSLRVYYPKPVT